MAFGLAYADHAPLIPLVAADLGLDDLRAGLLSTALFLSYLVTTLLGIAPAARLGPRRSVFVGLALATTGTALLAVAPVYGVALAGKAVQGIGSALAFVSATRYIAGLYGERRSHFALGLYGAGFPLGSALALAVMPTLAVTLGGWREAFAAEAILVGGATLAWTWSPRVPWTPAPGDMRDALRCANCWWTSLQHAAGFGLALASGTWITVYLLREFQLPLALSGVLGSLLLDVAVVARTLGGWLVAREHAPSRLVMRAGDASIIAGVALLALPGRPLAVALAGAVLVGVGVGVPYAAVFNTAAASLRSAPAAAQGLAAIGGTAGVMIGAPIMGLAVQTFGFSAAWAVVGGVAALAGGATFVMRGEEDLP
ncbi:MAG TPA: MFS transporter [Candidatus Limnocylindria bacterium]|nr:MFS transporter [Candidatus Limnocylindria bacterium]